MAKDPAFLFYPNDWLGGTMGMSFEEKGAYMELLMIQFNKGKFTLDQAKRTLNGSFDVVWPALSEKFIYEDGFFYNQRLLHEKSRRSKYTESRRNSRLQSDEDSVKIYLILDKDTGYYKIGSSVNPLRRFAEMTNQKSPAITVGLRDYVLFWVSKIVKRETEKEVHTIFKSKRITGEWFSLTKEDVLLIQKKYGDETYDSRTENVTENNTVLKELGSEKVNEAANAAWKDQRWKENVCMALSINLEELKKWMAMFNASICNDFIPDWDSSKYKKMIRGWISKQQEKGVKVDTSGLSKKSDAAPLTVLNHD